MNINPGVINAYPRHVIFAGIIYNPKTCHPIAVRISSNVKPAFIITSLKIWDVNTFTIIRYRPNIIETYNTETKFSYVKSPKTPNLVLKSNELPPKKYPEVIKLNDKNKLYK